MKIAFDLDNTLIRSEYDFELDKPSYTWLAYLLGGEKLRKGTKELIHFCQKQGWEVWVYTTSYRGIWYIRKIFCNYLVVVYFDKKLIIKYLKGYMFLFLIITNSTSKIKYLTINDLLFLCFLRFQ